MQRAKLIVVKCATCLRPHFRIGRYGYCTPMKLKGWCSCVLRPNGEIIKEGPMARGYEHLAGR